MKSWDKMESKSIAPLKFEVSVKHPSENDESHHCFRVGKISTGM